MFLLLLSKLKWDIFWKTIKTKRRLFLMYFREQAKFSAESP